MMAISFGRTAMPTTRKADEQEILSDVNAAGAVVEHTTVHLACTVDKLVWINAGIAPIASMGPMR